VRRRLPRAVKGVRRAWPLVLMAWERWQKLPAHEKERYKRQAQEYAKRGRKAIEARRRKR
jgi:TRAP-type C4-dicarboxylate transport system substrate-binding protein